MTHQTSKDYVQNSIECQKPGMEPSSKKLTLKYCRNG